MMGRWQAPGKKGYVRTLLGGQTLKKPTYGGRKEDVMKGPWDRMRGHDQKRKGSSWAGEKLTENCMVTKPDGHVGGGEGRESPESGGANVRQGGEG